MKRLMVLCFAILFLVLSILGILNYSFYSVEKIEQDKIRISISKPENETNTEFLNNIATAVQGLDADIMFRQVSTNSGKTVYSYYVTTHTNDFLDVPGEIKCSKVSDSVCLSTNKIPGYENYSLGVSSLFRDTVIYSWKDAAKNTLSTGAFFVANECSSDLVAVLNDMGYQVGIVGSVNVSAQLSIFLYSAIPALMLVVSMVFFTLTYSKNTMLRKVDGYSTLGIMMDDCHKHWKPFAVLFFSIEAATLIVAGILYKRAMLDYLSFYLKYLGIGFGVCLIGLLLVAYLILVRNGAEYIKGNVPSKGIYRVTMLAKVVFTVFIVFFLSIALRNIQIYYDVYATGSLVSEKVSGYVMFPINVSNKSIEGIEKGYCEFYRKTVDEYDGILIDASNYAYDLLSDSQLAESEGRDYIFINSNYLEFNPVVGVDGEPISKDSLDSRKINILIPTSKKSQIDIHVTKVSKSFEKDVNVIEYNGDLTEIYTYNPRNGTKSQGVLDCPVIYVVEENILNIFVIDFMSTGAYFLKPNTDDPFTELMPYMIEAGIAATTLETPYITSRFSDMLDQNLQMLLIYGVQSVILLIGLAGLILFSAKLYCSNYVKKITFCLIDGYSLLECIRGHLLSTGALYLICFLILNFISNSLLLTPNNWLLFMTAALDLFATIIACGVFARNNLYLVVKGEL